MAMIAGLVVTAAPVSADQIFVINTVAGTGVRGFSGDGGPAAAAMLAVPAKLAVDGSGRIYVADRSNLRVRQIGTDGVITTVAGGGSPDDGVGDGGPATGARLLPQGVALNSVGDIFIADSLHSTIRKVDASTGIISTVAGNNTQGYSGDGGPATSAQLNGAAGVALDAAGSMYIVEGGQNYLRKVDPSGIITTLTRPCDFNNDVAVGPDGQVYVACSFQVRRYDASGAGFQVAGNGNGCDGDGGAALDASMQNPSALAFDTSGNLYVTDRGCQTVRKIDTAGMITRVAGIPGTAGYSGDGGDPRLALLRLPLGVASDGRGGFYIGDAANMRVRHVELVPDLLGIKLTRSPNFPNVGDTMTYTVTVQNNDVRAATGVTMTQGLTGSTFVSATPSQGSCSYANNALTCQLGSIAAQGTATISVAVKLNAAVTLASTASVHANEADTYPSDDSATIQTQVGAPGCGRTITANTKLTADLGPCPANGLIVGADGITLDLGGHRLFGYPGPGHGNAAGVTIAGRSNVTLKSGTIDNFDGGVLMVNGGRHTVMGLWIHDNIGPDGGGLGDGIVGFDSGNNLLNNNRIDHNGTYDNIGCYGVGCAGTLIRNNVITNAVATTDPGGFGQGIIYNAYNSGPQTGALLPNITIRSNEIRNNASAGISTFNVVNSTIQANTVVNNGQPGRNGNGIATQLPFTAQSRVSSNKILDNVVHGSNRDGIQVWGEGNLIQGNDARDNGLDAVNGGYDLHDKSDVGAEEKCINNVWKDNLWGSGGYTPACAAGTGGGGPKPKPVAAPSSAAKASAAADAGDTGEPPFARRIPNL